MVVKMMGVGKSSVREGAKAVVTGVAVTGAEKVAWTDERGVIRVILILSVIDSFFVGIRFGVLGGGNFDR